LLAKECLSIFVVNYYHILQLHLYLQTMTFTGWIRLLIRLPLICLITLVHILLIVLCYPLKWLSTHYALVVGFITHSWGRCMMVLTGGKLDIQGSVPKPSFYLVSNHLSYADIWVLLASLRATFVAKHDLKSWPIMGQAMKLIGIIFVNRTKKMDVSRVNKLISKELHSPRGLIVFPEGTTTLGDLLKPYHSPLLEIPATQQFPVHAVLLHYEDKMGGGKSLFGSSYVPWWDDTSFVAHFISLLTKKGYIARLSFSDQTWQDESRKKLTESIYDWSEIEYENLKKHAQ